MSRNQNTFLTLIAILTLAAFCFAKTPKFTGKIVAYNLMQHESKTASAVQNEETVILSVPEQKKKYIKVVFSSFGTTQIEAKYFGGTEPLTVEVLRDHTCDENSPVFVSQTSVEQMGGTYLLTDAFKSSPPGKIKTLECYAAIYRKK